MNITRWTLSVLFVSLILFRGTAGAATPADTAYVPDPATVALWHFDETQGTTISDATGKNPGTSVDAMILPGVFGKGRSFNGLSAAITVPSSPSLNLGSGGFEIDAYFRITKPLNAILIRKGVSPSPGFSVSFSFGKVVGLIGGQELVSIWSDSTFHDSVWHKLVFQRDRVAKVLRLFVDGKSAAEPVPDTYSTPLENSEPLAIGRWAYDGMPWFMEGDLDEIRIEKIIATYDVTPDSLDFGTTRIGTKDTLSFTVTAGLQDTVHLVSMPVSSPVFKLLVSGMDIPPGKSLRIPVEYAPESAGIDTASIVIHTNIVGEAARRIRLKGNAFEIGHAPVLTSITPIPNSYYRARLAWVRSVDDSVGAVDQAVQYSVWRHISRLDAPGSAERVPDEIAAATAALMPEWDFVSTVPAAAMDEYAFVVDVPYDYQHPYVFTPMMVIAHTKGGSAYQSNTDSVHAAHPIVMGAGGNDTAIPARFSLEQIYPNPFNPTTTIRYQISDVRHLKLAVYDLLGREVAVLVNGYATAGSHSVTWNASGLPSGVYLCRMTAGPFSASRRMLLIR